MNKKEKLLEEIKEMEKKLNNMKEELNKPDEIVKFPQKGDVYYYYIPKGCIYDDIYDGGCIPNAYKTRKEAEQSYAKACYISRINATIDELNGDWKADFDNYIQLKYFICLDTHKDILVAANCNCWVTAGYSLKHIKSSEIAEKIISMYAYELRYIATQP